MIVLVTILGYLASLVETTADLQQVAGERSLFSFMSSATSAMAFSFATVTEQRF